MSKGEIEDLLKFEGIECKGFGVLPKYVMQDKISIGAKALYAYYCSLAGADIIAFPRRETILKQLGINKETFYRYQKELIAEGYITISQERTGTMTFSRNIYTLVQNPKKLQMRNAGVNEGYDTASYAGLKSYGYGIIPRIVMQDLRLEIKAKAIYAYYVVYTGAGKLAYLKRELILQHLAISKNTFNKYMSILIELNYITVKQRIEINGRFSTNDFILNSNPCCKKPEPCIKEAGVNEKVPCPKKPDTEESELCTECLNIEEKEPCPKIPDTEKSEPCPKIPYTENSEPCPKFPYMEKPEPCPKIPYTEKLEPCPKIPYTEKPEPCPKIPYTEKPEPCPKFPYTEKPDTNSININNTCNTIIPSINHGSDLERMMERWATGSTNDFNIPEEYFSESEITYVVHKLAEWEHYQCCPFDSKLKQSSYILFLDALVELCTNQHEMKLKDSTVNYIKVIRMLNRMIAGKYFYEGMANFELFMDVVLDDFVNAIRTRAVVDQFKYMRSCIWNVMLTREVRFNTSLQDMIYDV